MSISVSPPHTPYSSLVCIANSRQVVSTGQVAHTVLACQRATNSRRRRFDHSGPEAVHSLEPSQVSRRSLCGLQLSVESGLPVFFADPRSPWQRGSNENTNGLLRQYFPKGTDLSRWIAEDLAAIAHTLNTRPREILGWRTPAKALDEHLQSLQTSNFATTD